MIDNGLLSFVGDIVAAHVSNNVVSLHDLPKLIRTVHSALAGLDAASVSLEPVQKPAVSIRASVKPDCLVCLECGTQGKILRRHLAVAHALTPEQYRSRWGLPRDYPLVAPNYSEFRKATAHHIGLGKRAKGRGARVREATVAAELERIKSTDLAVDAAAVSPKENGEVS